MTIRAVSFDAAGTLIVPHPGVGAVYAEIASARGLVRDATALERAFPHAFAAVRLRWGVPYGADEDDARRFWAEVVEATFAEPLPAGLAQELFDAFAHAQRWRLVPGAVAALALTAHLGLPAALISNFDRRLQPLMAELGIGPFAVTVTSTMVGSAKPDPALMHEACRRLGVRADEVLHVGDSEREDGGMCLATGAHWLEVEPQRGIPLAEFSAILGLSPP